MRYDSGIICEIWSNDRKPNFWPIFSHAQSALGPSESTLRHPKRLQNNIWAQLLLLNSNIAYLWQLDQVWSHLEQYRPRNHRKTLFLIFAKCSNGPFWAYQNRLFSSQNRYQTCIWAQMLLIDSNIAYFWHLDQVWSRSEHCGLRNIQKHLFFVLAEMLKLLSSELSEMTFLDPKMLSTPNITTNAISWRNYLVSTTTWPSMKKFWSEMTE